MSLIFCDFQAHSPDFVKKSNAFPLHTRFLLFEEKYFCEIAKKDLHFFVKYAKIYHSGFLKGRVAPCVISPFFAFSNVSDGNGSKEMEFCTNVKMPKSHSNRKELRLLHRMILYYG